MGHGDLVSQAEDVADQVSSCPRQMRVLSRPHWAGTLCGCVKHLAVESSKIRA